MEQALIFGTGKAPSECDFLTCFWRLEGMRLGTEPTRPPTLLCISIAVPSILYAKTDLDTSPFYLAMAPFGVHFRLQAENHSKSVRGRITDYF